ncbi:SIR2 family protein [Salipiger thiooxidans]|uniref:P-loop NTPase n=1 Tax=Salipiger thiooxidans TaxID=282683 RepID=UPI001A8D3BDB|nr:SIR2 family protein [Salipiger thiooxidans]MBN8190341.1 SIR2 family protein [Salipiger thiooxidans]
MSEAEKREHIRDRLSGCTPGDTVNAIKEYYWKRIFTLNADDTLNAAYERSAKQSPRFLHFSDPYEDFQAKSDVPIINLHGSVLRHEDGYVFSYQEYARITKGQNPWMVILSNSIRSEPIIISGASLEESDIEYYLSYRSETTARDDFPPSIFVSSDVNRLSESLCIEHNLIQFAGYSSDFFAYLRGQLPNPPRIEEQASSGVAGILPDAVSRSARMHFDADFELVPYLEEGTSSSNKFYYGQPPSWNDLAAKLDVPRKESAALLHSAPEDRELGRQLVVLFGPTGCGKTTILKRVAYSLASKGTHYVLWTSELARLSRTTADTLDMIDGSVALIVDNLADHAQAISDVLSISEKEDVFIIGAERSYREDYLVKTFGSGGFSSINVEPLSQLDIKRLVDVLVDRALIGSHRALSGHTAFLKSLRRDPIAIASCRVINDFRPLDRIIADLRQQSSKEEILTYVMASIAEHCHKSGVRAEILSREVSGNTLSSMISGKSPLHLKEIDVHHGAEFIGAENSTLAEVIVARVNQDSPGVVFEAFASLANGLAPYVNRNAIRSRTPEARLAGRLFDFDDIVKKYLGPRTEDFYDQSREAWRWNSRFWEQYALMKLERAVACDDDIIRFELMSEALQRARYSVAIEKHPFGLNTLAKVLMTFVSLGHRDSTLFFMEASQHVRDAIEIESKYRRSSQHPYSTLIHGALDLIDHGIAIPDSEVSHLRDLTAYAIDRWNSDQVMKDRGERLLQLI